MGLHSEGDVHIPQDETVQCSKCGNWATPIKSGSAKVVLITPETAPEMIARCTSCGKLFCGGCFLKMDPSGFGISECPECAEPLGYCD